MEPSSGPVDQLFDQYLPKIPTDVWSPILTCFCIQSDVDISTSVIYMQTWQPMFTCICWQDVDMVTSVNEIHYNCRHFMLPIQYCTRNIYMYVVSTILKSKRF